MLEEMLDIEFDIKDFDVNKFTTIEKLIDFCHMKGKPSK